jgi:hypothetical protein
MASFYYIDGVHNTECRKTNIFRGTTNIKPQMYLLKRCLKALIENSLEFDGCIIFVLLVTFEIFKFFGYGIKVNKSIFLSI